MGGICDGIMHIQCIAFQSGNEKIAAEILKGFGIPAGKKECKTGEKDKGQDCAQCGFAPFGKIGKIEFFQWNYLMLFLSIYDTGRKKMRKPLKINLYIYKYRTSVRLCMFV